MKKFVLALFSVLVVVACNEKKSDTNLHIIGNIKGLKKGTLYIQKVVDTSLIAIDTIQIDGDSNFTSDLKIESPEMYYLFLDRGVSNSMDNNLLFFAEEGNINIHTSLEHFLSDVKITGSKNQAKYEEYRKVIARFNDENLSLLEQKFKAIQDKNAPATAILEEKQKQNIKRRYLFVTNFALNNRTMEIAPYLALTEISDINLKYLDTVQKSMTPKVAKSKYGKRLIELYTERKKTE